MAHEAALTLQLEKHYTVKEEPLSAKTLYKDCQRCSENVVLDPMKAANPLFYSLGSFSQNFLF